MPFYVYALHTDSKVNHCLGCFADYKGAEICERDKGKDPEDNHFVMMIYAESKIHVLRKIKEIRRERGLPGF